MSRETSGEIAGWHHIHGLVSGRRSDTPLMEPGAPEKLIELLEHFSSIYYGKIAGFSIQGSEYGLVVHFPKEREVVSRKELRRRAALMYPTEQQKKLIARWTDDDWDHYRQRLFSFSEFMRNFQAAYARWYNWVFDRRGRFWANRFKSTLLENRKIALDCLLYLESEAVRLGHVKRPEDWPGNSLHLRMAAGGQWLYPLAKVLRASSEEEALDEFRQRLAWRCGGSTPEIREEILEAEIKRGFEDPGMNLEVQPFWKDGIAVGSEKFIQKMVDALRDDGAFKKRKKAIPQLGGILHSLRRERRSKPRKPPVG